MNARIVTFVIGMALTVGGTLAGCAQSESLQEKVDKRIASISQADKDSMCESYDLFGPDFIKTLVDGQAAQGDVTQEEADLVFQRIVELCDAK